MFREVNPSAGLRNKSWGLLLLSMLNNYDRKGVCLASMTRCSRPPHVMLRGIEKRWIVDEDKDRYILKSL
jgi:hypothetical protein